MPASVPAFGTMGDMASHALTLEDDLVRAFWQERILCTVTLIRADGRPHVTPMGIALGEDCAWGITNRSSLKARLVRTPRPIAVCQVDGRRWSTLYGTATLQTDSDTVATAVQAYAARYRQPRPNPDRVAIRIEIEQLVGHVPDVGTAA